MNKHLLDQLYNLIQERRCAELPSSYIARLFDKGIARIAQKVGEEGVETALATVVGSDEELIGEAADLIFHLWIALVARNIDPELIWAELQRRDHHNAINQATLNK